MSRRLGVIVVVLAVFLCVMQFDLSSALTSQTDGRGPVVGEAKARLVEGYGTQPLHFERPEGQSDAKAAYNARGQGYGLLLSSAELTLTLKRGRLAPSLATPGSPSAEERPASGTTVRVRLGGANPKARLTGLDPLPSRSNYFIGNDPTKWRTNVPHYAKVKLESVYPGIDLVFYGNGRQLEYDFVVAPGADPRQIRLAFDGVDAAYLKANGDLGLSLPSGELTFQAPRVYQASDGTQHPVPARFVMGNKGEVGFEVGNYDAGRALVIDPVLSYSTYLGGGTGVDTGDWGNGIAVDGAGNAYVVGVAYPTDFPTTEGAFDRSGGYAAFVAKFDPSGALVYSTFLGGGGYVTEARAIAVDSTGHAYVTGYTGRTDFPTTPGVFQTTCAPGGSPYGCNDAFVVKLNPQGSGLVYSTYLGGPSDPATPGVYGDDNGNGIAIDSEGNAYVTGLTRSNSFPVTPNAFQTTYAGGWADVFIAKLNASGSALVYATYLGGTGGSLHGDEPYAIAVDGQGHAYVTGLTTSADFPTTAGAFKPTWSGYTEGFISKLSADGSSLTYSTYLGGPGAGRIYGGRGIAVDAAGNAYVTGLAEDGFSTTPGAFQPKCATAPALCSDAFVLKLNPSGSAPVWSTYLGGSSGEQGNAIALDSQGHVYVTGSTLSTDFPTRFPVQGTYAGGDNSWHGDYYGGDVVVTKLSSDGSRALYSTYLGGSGADAGLGIAVDQAGNAYVTGLTASTDFPTVNAVQSSNHGSWDVIVFKLGAVTYNLTLAKAGTGTGTVTSNPSGVTCGSTCSAAFDEGERVTLTATPTTGSLFAGWSGACTGTGTCVVVMDQARSVTATFNVPPLSVTSLAADKTAPQPASTTITFTATAANGTAPYQYKWWVYNGSTWSNPQNWSPTNTFAWTPSPGTYEIQLWARSSGNTADAPEAYARMAPYSITAPPPLSVTSLTADKASPQVAGTAITFTATATGGILPREYKWWVYNGSTWSNPQNWSPTNTFAWTPSPGTYEIQLWARNAGVTADTPQAYARMAPYTITPSASGLTVALAADKTAPQPASTTITFTATAANGTAPYQYKWWVYNGSTWSNPQNWSPTNTFAWTPSPGTYEIQLWARSSGNTADAPEAYARMAPYSITAPPPLSVTSLTADKASPQAAGTAITFTATATGGILPREYKWWVYNGSTWSNPQNWSPTNTFAWTPSPGTYEIQLWARNAGVTADTPQAYARMAPYTITPSASGLTVALAADKTAPQPASTTITFTATAANGTAPYQYKWWVYNGSTWSNPQNWSTTPTFAWTPSPGTYEIQLWARSSGNTADAPEAYARMAPYSITAPPPLSVTSLTADKASPQPVNTAITFTAAATGGSAPYEYKWWVEKGGAWTVGQAWAAGNTFPWTPTGWGAYTLQVWVRNSGSTRDAPDAYANLAYTVSSSLHVTSVSGNKATPQLVGTAITLTATATGGTAPLQYKWWVYNGTTWSNPQNWNPTNTFAWTPTLAGNYILEVWVRSSGNTADAPEAYGDLGYVIVPDVRGTYTVSGNATQSSCTFPGDNGTFPFTGTINILTQTGQTFSSTGSFNTGDGIVSATLTGTVTGAGQVSGTLTMTSSLGMSATLTFSGTLVGNTITITFSGQSHEGSNSCNLTGSFTGTR